jgi:hypothetical protein
MAGRLGCCSFLIESSSVIAIGFVAVAASDIS